MKIEYFAENGNRFKANLHCHTTFSDGAKTPAEIKEIYRKEGYNIVAYSDHNILIDHSELNDKDFLAMLAVEYDVKKAGEANTNFRPCYHINFFPKKAGQTSVPCYSPRYTREDFIGKQAHHGTEDYVRSYEDVQDMIDRFAADGFLVQINHPTWSLQTTSDYLHLHSFFAVELYNHGCYVDGFDELNTHVWDDLLMSGKRVWGTATDDNHNKKPNTPYWDSCGGFTVIQADALTQEAVTDALEKGKFYASMGPLFRSIVLEDNTLKIETSPVSRVLLTTGHRQAQVAYPAEGETTITEATFDLSRIITGDYVRLTLIDEQGNRAWSQPIYDYIGREA